MQPAVTAHASWLGVLSCLAATSGGPVAGLVLFVCKWFCEERDGFGEAVELAGHELNLNRLGIGAVLKIGSEFILLFFASNGGSCDFCNILT